MLKYYLKFALRNIRRQQIYSIINIFGLALGIALFLIIALYVSNEYSYDKYNKNYERIYRMEFGNWCVIPPGYGHLLNGQIPEIEKLCRAHYNREVLFSYETSNSTMQTKNIIRNSFGVDSTFFEIFDAEFISGTAENSLREPLTIVITESFAKQLFGDEDAYHKEIMVDNSVNMRVDGVIKDPQNSQFMSEAFYSVSSNNHFQGEGSTENLRSSNYLTYFLFHKGFDVDQIRTKIFTFYKEYEASQLVYDDNTEEDIILRPLKDIYFFKEAQYESGIKHGNKPVVNAFIIIAIFILLIAGINFINLTTARAAIRSKEVGIKKVVGSSRSSLILHFLIESVMISAFAMLIALTMLQILLPEFNNIALTDLSFDVIFNFQGILLMSLLAILIGILSGLYPSFYLSYFKPIQALKGESKSGKAAGLFRKILISFQFIIAAILIAGTVVVNQQINFLKNKDLGFKKEKIINFNLIFRSSKAKKDDFKQKLLQNPNILLVSFSHGIPGNTRNTNTFEWREGVSVQSRVTSVDKDFFKLYNIKLLKGELINWELESEQRKTVLINETLAKEIGWDEPIGKTVNRDGVLYTTFMQADFRIVGVFKDYHIESLHTPVAPLAITWDERTHWQASIKISGNNISQTLEYIENKWAEYAPAFPFNFSFLDQKFDQMYKSEERMQKIAIYFSVLAIFIACLGLFGLSAFMTQRRFKEIGVRKVLGASIPQIIIKLSREFTILVLISNLIAIPMAWLIFSKWLDDYPYHVDVQWWVFPIATITTLVVALATVSFHAVKAAKGNPIDAIRHE